MNFTRTHGLTGRGFGSREMTFGVFAIETSLNARQVGDTSVHIIIKAGKSWLTSGLMRFM
jgi:hypothetical protein